MRFDAIVGNPPYHLSYEGGVESSVRSLYDVFVENAMSLHPHYISMIIPSRWYTGGMGLNRFRKMMINSRNLKVLVDYFQAIKCFPDMDIAGGVCYFLWDSDSLGKCMMISNHMRHTELLRDSLNYRGVLVRFNESFPILKKIDQKNEERFIDCVSTRNPFGIPDEAEIHEDPAEGRARIYAYPRNGYVDSSAVSKNRQVIDRYKVFISKACDWRGGFPHVILARPFIGSPGEVCSGTYLLAGEYTDLEMAENVVSYIKTKFFRFLVLLMRNTQNVPKEVYQFVPIQNFNRPWTDEELYDKYGLDEQERAFIESMILPMK